MNRPLRRPDLPLTTQAAEGLARRRWTVAEIERLLRAGIIQDERFELIGGEIVPMSPKGARHERVKHALLRRWYDLRLPDVVIGVETTLRLAADMFVDPDITVFPSAIGFEALTSETLLLVVEVSDTMNAYDRTTKAALYAEHGVREYWAIDAHSLETRVFKAPANGRFEEVLDVARDQPLRPHLIPALALKLAELGIHGQPLLR